MTPSRPILTAAEMRAAENRAITQGASVDSLMERAGAAVAEVVWRYAAGASTLVLCGPGNNGGDGYVAARLLRERGVDVRIAALGEPRGGAAIAARARYAGIVESFEQAAPAAVLVDGLFGTGLTRGLDPALAARLAALAEAARHRIAIDVPSGVGSDDGSTFGATLPSWHLTLALGTLKPAHRLQPAAGLCGRVVVADLGLGAVESAITEISRPHLPAPRADDHKYMRGMVAVVGGEMAGAGLLAAGAAQRAGAGYVQLVGGSGSGGLAALVHRATPAALGDPRVGAVVCGPGLGRGAAGKVAVEHALGCGRPLVLDADALDGLALERSRMLPAQSILTPHGGEFHRLFGDLHGSKLDQARAAARIAGAVIVLKGSDTVVAAPDGRAAIAPPASSWLSTAGTGDVLAGIAGAMRARMADPFLAARAAVWLHGAAAAAAGPVLVADDLLDHLGAAVASCG